MNDPIIDALGRLADTDTAPPGLLDKVVSRWTTVPGPTGELYVAFTDRGISYLRVAGDEGGFLEAYRARFGRPLVATDRPPAGLVPALRTGRGRKLAVDLRGLTTFEQDVLAATREIPVGEVRPYAWIAREIGRPRAVRAVGSALGRNPVPLVIPCHRVTRSDGIPGGYVFGPAMKESLLRHEGANLDAIHDLAGRSVFYLASDTTGIVCYPSCHHARRITAPHRHGFRTLGEAATAGYRPCLDCRPAGS